MIDPNATRRKLQAELGKITDAAWNRIGEVLGNLAAYVEAEEDYENSVRDFYAVAALNASGSASQRPQPKARAGNRRGVYVRPLKRRWRMYVFAEDRGKPHDFVRIAREWNQQTGANVSAGGYERLYYKTVSEAWSPEFEKHVLDPVKRETERYKERWEAWQESDSIHQFCALIEMSGSLEATLDLGMHRVISAGRDGSPFFSNIWVQLWEVVKFAYATDPLTPEEQPRVTAALLTPRACLG